MWTIRRRSAWRSSHKSCTSAALRSLTGDQFTSGFVARNALITWATPAGFSQNGLWPRPSKIFTCAFGKHLSAICALALP